MGQKAKYFRKMTSTSPEVLSTLGPLEEKFIFLSPLGFLLFQEIRTFHIKDSKFAFQNLSIDILIMLQLYVKKLLRFLGNVIKPLKYFNILQSHMRDGQFLD